MKKYLCALTALCIVFTGLSGCSSQSNNSDEQSSKESQTEFISKPLTGGAAQIPELDIKNYDIPDNEAMQFLSKMKIGWNLGNTFDATSNVGYTKDEMNLESAWCGAVTTEQMIFDIKSAGFNTLRLPVSWHNHLTDENFTISEQWLDRVKEVVDYAINNDMYVILNSHHDCSKDSYYPQSENYETSQKYITAIWSQLSEKFADYDEHLLFESMNEPRLIGTPYEWNFQANNEQCQDAMDCINKLNQVFVDTIRSKSGKNSDRYLLIPGYSASPESAVSDLFVMPNDTADNKLIVSVHAYRPYFFSLAGISDNGSTNEFSLDNKQQTGDIDSFLDSLYNKYSANGTPVVIGEFGSRIKNDNLQSRVDCSSYYVAAAKARGIVCCYWDNNAFSGSGENFGIYYRNSNIWRFPDVVLGMIQYAE